MSTPRLSFDLWPSGIQQADVPANNNARRIDALLHIAAVSHTVAAQPASPVIGDVYILPAAATGTDWAGQPADTIAYYDGAWAFFAPRDGVTAITDDLVSLVYVGVWREQSRRHFVESGGIVTPNGANLSIDISAGLIASHAFGITAAAAKVAPSIEYRLSDGTAFAPANVLDPGFYEAAGLRTALTAGNWSVHRVYVHAQIDSVIVQYGQAEYPTLADAVIGALADDHITETGIAGGAAMVARIAVKGGASSLQNAADARIITPRGAT